MKRNKILLISLLAIFCLSITAVSATDFDNNTIINENQNIIENQNNIVIEEENQDNHLSNLSQEELNEDVNQNSSLLLSNSEKELEEVGLKKITLSKILEAASNYIFQGTSKRLPLIVSINGIRYSNVAFTEMMVKAIYNIYRNNMSDIIAINHGSAGYSSYFPKDLKSYSSNKQLYMKMVNDLYGKKLPTFYKYSKKYLNRFNAPYSVYSLLLAHVLDDYRRHGSLPQHVYINFKKHNNFDSIENHAKKSNYKSNSNYNSIHKNITKSDNLENTGNPLLMLLFALAILPILRIKNKRL